MLASNLARDTLILTEYFLFSKGLLLWWPLFFFLKYHALKTLKTSANQSYFIFHLVVPHISNPTEQVSGYFNDCFVGYHFPAISFV